MKGSIVLVNFYREIEHVNSRPLMPLASLYLASYLNHKKYNVIIQEVANKKDIDHLIEEAVSINPLLIGISCTFGLYTDEYIEYSLKIKIKNTCRI